MSACESSLRHIFAQNSPSSWKQITALNPPIDHSFGDIFGEQHFDEKRNPISSSSSCSSPLSNNSEDNKWVDDKRNEYKGSSYHRRNDSFSSLNSESLQICTEGLGSESLDDTEDLKIDSSCPWRNNHNKNDNNKNNDENYQYRNNNNNNNSSYKMEEKMPVRGYSGYEYRKGKTNGKTFPPPISCIGRTGKPRVCFQSYREDGRFVLKEMKIPRHESLHASREDGRLRLCFVQPSDQDEDDEDYGGEEEDEGEEEEEEAGKGVNNVDEGEEKGGRKEETEVRDDIERGHP